MTILVSHVLTRSNLIWYIKFINTITDPKLSQTLLLVFKIFNWIHHIYKKKSHYLNYVIHTENSICYEDTKEPNMDNKFVADLKSNPRHKLILAYIRTLISSCIVLLRGLTCFYIFSLLYLGCGWWRARERSPQLLHANSSLPTY